MPRWQGLVLSARPLASSPPSQMPQTASRPTASPLQMPMPGWRDGPVHALGQRPHRRPCQCHKQLLVRLNSATGLIATPANSTNIATAHSERAARCTVAADNAVSGFSPDCFAVANTHALLIKSFCALNLPTRRPATVPFDYITLPMPMPSCEPLHMELASSWHCRQQQRPHRRPRPCHKQPASHPTTSPAGSCALNSATDLIAAFANAINSC